MMLLMLFQNAQIKIKKIDSLFLAEKRKLVDDLMNNEERA
jgi:hypothetical protein